MLDFMLSLNRPFDLRGGGIKFSMFPKFQKKVQIILGWGGGKKIMVFFPAFDKSSLKLCQNVKKISKSVRICPKTFLQPLDWGGWG